ncbi:hypothetical protein Tco_0268706 [Tanacetum coccineum]
MLALGNYVQWKSKIKRYIDTKPNNEHIHYCLQNPIFKFKWTEKTVPVVEGSSETTTEGFVTLVKKSQELKTVSYHKLYDILKQHQNEVNELRAERLARTANPLALVAQQQPVYHPQNHLNHYTQNSSTRSQPAATRNRDDEMSKEKDIDKLMALISLSFKKIYKPTNNNLRTLSNTIKAHRDNTTRINKELEAHYLYMAKIQEVTPDATDNYGPIFDTEPLQKEQGDTNITIDSLDMRINEEMVDHDDDDLAKERDLLASLIEKLKCVIDDNKNRNKFLESSNKTLIDKLKDLKKFQVKLDRYHDVNYASKMEIDCAKAKDDLVSYKMES